MNATAPVPPAGQAPDRAAAGLPHGILAGFATTVLILTAIAIWTPWLMDRTGPITAEFIALGCNRLLPVVLSSLLLSLAGLTGTAIMVWARRRALLSPMAVLSRRRWMPAPPPRGDRGLIGRCARWPQAIAVTLLSYAAIASAWSTLSSAGIPAVPSATNLTLGAIAIALAFPFLIVERVVAAIPETRLPESPPLRALLLLPVLTLPAAGLMLIATGLGVPYAARLDGAIALPLIAIALELSLRAQARCFLPAPGAEDARAAIDAILARLIAEGVLSRGLTAPIRDHLGLDFSRGWALRFIRAAIPPVALLLLVLSWGLSGLVLVGLDQRAIYERFGQPAAVLHPGLHAILPWPMGRVRRLEFGTLHELSLSEPAAMAEPIRTAAEDPPPPDADRLWEQAHPAELIFLIASEAAGRQTFQVVAADIKIRYRIGLTDAAALKAAYALADPEARLRGAAGRAIARFFATRTLDAVLGENREKMALDLRAAIQADLDAANAGLDLAAVAIEAVHPPAGAAEAYHAVQAAQIAAITSISGERTMAASTKAKAEQYATEIVARAQAAGAETRGTASADLTRFTADHAAAQAGGESFLFERRLTAIAAGLAKSTLTILDHRIDPADAPMLDLRPQGAGTARPPGTDQD